MYSVSLLGKIVLFCDTCLELRRALLLLGVRPIPQYSFQYLPLGLFANSSKNTTPPVNCCNLPVYRQPDRALLPL